MKKIFVIITVLLTFSKVNLAQVSIQPVLPTVGIVQKSQLWNLLVVNNTSSSYECRLSLVLRDRITGIELLTAASGIFTLSQGAKQLNANVVAPIQYNNLQMGIDNKLQGLLPVGSYMVCYTLTGVLQKELNLAEECVPFDIEPLSPPMLITPTDSSILEVAPVQFTWIPPTPDGMFNGLHYDVIIAPINEGQKAAEAIQENLPFYNEGNHLSTLLNYPSSMPSFEKDKWYAWQVLAKDNQNYAGKSEVWVFKVTSDKVQKIINESPYIKVTTYPQAISTVHQGVLKIEYYHPLSDGVIQIRVIDDNSRNGKYLFTTKLDVKAGQNFLQYDLSKKIKLNEQNIYRVEIENLATEKFVLKFKAKKY